MSFFKLKAVNLLDNIVGLTQQIDIAQVLH